MTDAALPETPAQALLRPELELGLLALLGAGSLLLLYLLVRVSALVPMSRPRRALLRRLAPPVIAVAVVLYTLFALRIALRSTGLGQVYALGAVAFLLAAALFPTLKNVAAGLVTRASQSCEVGDSVQLPDVQGRVVRMGLWAVVMETRDGKLASVPYAELVRYPLIKEPRLEGGVLHIFQLSAVPGSSISAVKHLLTEHALCSYYTSAVRRPLVRPLGNDRYEVTVFALHVDYGPAIEADVRRAPIVAQS